MKSIPRNVVVFLERQGFVIASTLDKNGKIHCAAKGIVGIDPVGQIYIIDLYCRRTFANLKKNPTISITAVDDLQFEGYTLKGKAKIVKRSQIQDHVIKSWEHKIIKRISQRVIKNIKRSKKSLHQPEVHLPQPRYLIVVNVEDIVDLTPGHLKPPALKNYEYK